MERSIAQEFSVIMFTTRITKLARRYYGGGTENNIFAVKFQSAPTVELWHEEGS